MCCVIDAIPVDAATKPNYSTPTQPRPPLHSSYDIPFSSTKLKLSSTRVDNTSIVLRNKAPIWYHPQHCWYLDFHGRVIMPSNKNFQLISSPKKGRPGPGHEYGVILQFGKVRKDVFIMDYRYPLSAFQAFAICLASFDAKIALRQSVISTERFI